MSVASGRNSITVKGPATSAEEYTCCASFHLALPYLEGRNSEEERSIIRMNAEPTKMIVDH